MAEQLNTALSSVNASLALCDACTMNYARARLLKSRLQTINDQLLSSYSTYTQSTFSTNAITNLLDAIDKAKVLLSDWAPTGPTRIKVIWRTLQSRGFGKSFTTVLQYLDASMQGLTGGNGAIFHPTNAGVIRQAVSADTHKLVQSIMEASGNDVSLLETIVAGERGGSLELLVNMLADLGCDTRPLIERISTRRDDDARYITHSDIIGSAGSVDELAWETGQILAFNKKMRERGLKGRPLPHPCIAKDALVIHESSSVCIGAGAVADVYRAMYNRKHDVAIKMARTAGDPQAGMLSPLTQRDILREAQVMCTLSSPHMVRCFGIIPEMNSALVMEYMEDGSLHDYLRRLKASAGVAPHEPFVELGSERLQLALDAACAVEYLHTCHTLGGAVVHGDLKTGGLLVHGGRAKLANFGCTVTPSAYTRSLTTATANSVSNSSSDSGSSSASNSASDSVFNSVSNSVLTSVSNSVFNSEFDLVSNSAPISALNSVPNSASNSLSISASNPSKVFPCVYHAPEQLRALSAPESQDSPPRDAQTDVYALGAVLYEIMTCCVPFFHLGMSLNDPLLLRLIASGKKHPRFNELQHASPDLTALIQACMALNPEQRPSIKKVTECLSQLLRSPTSVLAASQQDSPRRPDDFASSMARPFGGRGRLDSHSKPSCGTLDGERSSERLHSQYDGSSSSGRSAHPPSSPWGSTLYDNSSRPSTSTRPPAHTGVSPTRASDTSSQRSSNTHTGVTPLRSSNTSSQQSSIPHTGVTPLRASVASSQRSSNTHTGVHSPVAASDASSQYHSTTYSGVSPTKASVASSQRSSNTHTGVSLGYAASDASSQYRSTVYTGVSPLRASDTSSQRSSTAHTGVNSPVAASDASSQYHSTKYTGVSPARASVASSQRSSATHTGVSPLRASDTSSQRSSNTYTGAYSPIAASDASPQYHTTIYSGISPLRASVASSQRSSNTHTGVHSPVAASDASTQYRSTTYSGVSPARASDSSSQQSSIPHTGVSPLRASDTSSQRSSNTHTGVSLAYVASDTSSQYRSTRYSGVSPTRASVASSQRSSTTHTGVSLGYAASDASSQYHSTIYTGVSPTRASDTSSQRSSNTHTGVICFAASDASADQMLRSDQIRSGTRYPSTANKAATGAVPFSTLRSHCNSVNCVHFSPCGSWLASASDDMTVRVWHLGHATTASIPQSATNTPPQTITTSKILHHNPTARKGSFLLRTCTAPAVEALRVKSVAFAPVNQPLRLATGSTDGAVRMWACGDSGRSAVLGERTRRNPWSLTHTLATHKGSVSCVSFASSGTLLASGSWDRTVRLLNMETMESGLQVLKGHADKVTGVGFLMGDLSVASASQDGTVRLWDTLTGQRTRCFQHCQQSQSDDTRADKDDVGCVVSSVCCSPTSPLLASAACDGCIRMWDPRTGACVTIIKAHDAGVKSVCFSQDGMYLASASCDKSAKIFEISTGRCLQVLRCQNGDVNWVAFSPDGRVVASASRDATVCLWDNSRDPQSASTTWYTDI